MFINNEGRNNYFYIFIIFIFLFFRFYTSMANSSLVEVIMKTADTVMGQINGANQNDQMKPEFYILLKTF